MDLGLAGRTALVTGAGSGIGRAVCRVLAAEGCRVVAIGRTASTLDETVAGIPGASVFVADVRLQASWDRILGAVGRADILVSAAAAPNTSARLTAVTPDAWQKAIDTNLTAVWCGMAAVIPGMVQAGWGRLVALGSLMGEQGGFQDGPYAVSKGGLIALVRTAALEYGSRGVTSNLVVPGRIDTERTVGVSERVADALRKAIPLGRFGKPEEVAAAVGFVCSDLAAYMTGAVVHMTGGRELGKLGI